MSCLLNIFWLSVGLHVHGDKNVRGNTLNNCLLLTEVYNCNKITKIIQIQSGFDWSMFGSKDLLYSYNNWTLIVHIQFLQIHRSRKEDLIICIHYFPMPATSAPTAAVPATWPTPCTMLSQVSLSLEIKFYHVDNITSLRNPQIISCPYRPETLQAWMWPDYGYYTTKHQQLIV